jgi:hypothetical protein
LNFSRPLHGLAYFWTNIPSAKALGYFQSSARRTKLKHTGQFTDSIISIDMPAMNRWAIFKRPPADYTNKRPNNMRWIKLEPDANYCAGTGAFFASFSRVSVM